MYRYISTIIYPPASMPGPPCLHLSPLWQAHLAPLHFPAVPAAGVREASGGLCVSVPGEAPRRRARVTCWKTTSGTINRYARNKGEISQITVVWISYYYYAPINQI